MTSSYMSKNQSDCVGKAGFFVYITQSRKPVFQHCRSPIVFKLSVAYANEVARYPPPLFYPSSRSAAACLRDRRSRPTNTRIAPIASKASDVGSGMALTPVTTVFNAGLSVPNWNCMELMPVEELTPVMLSTKVAVPKRNGLWTLPTIEEFAAEYALLPSGLPIKVSVAMGLPMVVRSNANGDGGETRFQFVASELVVVKPPPRSR